MPSYPAVIKQAAIINRSIPTKMLGICFAVDQTPLSEGLRSDRRFIPALLSPFCVRRAARSSDESRSLSDSDFIASSAELLSPPGRRSASR